MAIHRARFCLRCGETLVIQDDHGSDRPTCPSCRFVYYRNPVPAAGVVLTRESEVLMVKRRYAPRPGAWCLPSGFMEYGETPERCALRELREETGVRGRLTGLLGVYSGLDDPRVRAVLIVFTAKLAGGTLAAGDDAIDASWFPLGRLPRAIAFAAHRQALREYRERA
jgi:ADP-ribose pyrophosphatase YjhB (NUDIX family)